MKSLSILLLACVVIFMSSCSKDNATVIPAQVSQKSLGIVVPKLNNGSMTGNLLLLNDGRTANPISGIANFNTIKTGTKLSLLFVAGATKNGILDITVTKSTLAQDSVFTPVVTTNTDPTTPVPTLDPIVPATFFAGTFTGSVDYLSPVPIPGDTSLIVTHPVSITFSSPNSYTCLGSASSYPGSGSGTFTISFNPTFTWMGEITFTDATANEGDELVLNGTLKYYITNSNLLCLYKDNDPKRIYSFYLSK